MNICCTMCGTEQGGGGGGAPLDPHADLRSHSPRVAVDGREDEGVEREDAGASGHEEDGPEPRRLLLDLALDAQDHAARDRPHHALRGRRARQNSKEKIKNGMSQPNKVEQRT